MSGLGTWDSEYLLNNTIVDTTSKRSGGKNVSMMLGIMVGGVNSTSTQCIMFSS